MKNMYVLLFLLICGFANAQIVNIPDYRFKQALLEHNPRIDTNNNGEIEISEAESTAFINVPAKSITSFEGIQNFINLIEIRFPYNKLTTVDFTENVLLEKIYGNNNLLSEINLALNPNLYFIELSNNNLTNMVFSQNIELFELRISNNYLTEIDISSNQTLNILDVSENNITELDLSQNQFIVLLYAWSNNLNYLDIRNGNNDSFSVMYAYDNPNLNCIKVDDVNFANSKICDEPNRHGWCKDETANYSEDCQLGTEDFTIADIQLFPNPTGNLLNIQSKQNIENVKIYSTQGILVDEVSSKIIDVSQLSVGIYFVRVALGGKSFTKKFIKE